MGLEDATSEVRNRHATAAVDAASGVLTFLYALEDGPADQSYGAHCAELAGFPSHVVKASQRRAAEFEAGNEFGKIAKRSRTEAPEENSALAYVMAATDEEEFVRRALENARSDELRVAIRGGS